MHIWDNQEIQGRFFEHSAARLDILHRAVDDDGLGTVLALTRALAAAICGVDRVPVVDDHQRALLYVLTELLVVTRAIAELNAKRSLLADCVHLEADVKALPQR